MRGLCDSWGDLYAVLVSSPGQREIASTGQHDIASTDPNFPTTAEEAAARYEAALASYTAARSSSDVAESHGRVWRAFHGGAIQKAEDDVAQAQSRLRRARSALGPNAVGAAARTWGVFSGSPSYHLEQTLDAVLEAVDSSGRDIHDAAHELRDVLANRRMAAECEDLEAAPAVTAAVRTVIARLDDWEPDRRAEILRWQGEVRPLLRRLLLEHLASEDRPLPATVEEMDRHGQPVTLSVSRPADVDLRTGRPDEIRIHDFVVHGDLKGHGLGSAVLAHLCRWADSRRLDLVGELHSGGDQSGGQSAGQVRRLAVWYSRHGFNAQGQPGLRAELWADGAPIRRPAGAGWAASAGL